MVTVTIDLPDEVNRMVEHFKIDYGMKDKRDAIVELLKKCSVERSNETMEDLFKQADKMKPTGLSTKDIVKMRREMYE
jgi:hypothetical protein